MLELTKKYENIITEVFFVVIGASILLLNIFVFSEIIPIFTPFFNIAGALIAIVPPFLIYYSKYKINKEMESEFILFVTDLTESIDSGMTLPIALKHSAKRDYSSLTPYVREISTKVDWGIPFEKALVLFAEKSKSTPIRRSVSTIIETYKVGGKLSDTLRAIGRSLIEINKIKQERSASVQSQLVTSYLIFFVFIFILVILQTFLLPALPSTTGTDVSDTGAEIPPELFAQTFINFIIVQGFFAGLATGKMAEGSLVAGFKHSLMLITIGYTIFSFLSQFQIRLF